MKNLRYNLDWLPFPIHSAAIKLMSGPFSWAHNQKQQTVFTRFIRATWRAL